MDLINEHKARKGLIKQRLNDFKQLDKSKWIDEFLFCILTPQSNAQSCWKAVLELKEKGINKMSEKQIASVLKSKTRFHNNKARYVILALKDWDKIADKINEFGDRDIKELRNWIAENVYGMGYKEAGHFLRNIGKSDNKVAILDRHILRNLKGYGVIKEDKLNGKQGYFDVEKSFIGFSEKVGIPIDELDLLFWSRENGEVFK